MINFEIAEISNNIIMESRDAVIFENIFLLKNNLPRLIKESSSYGLIPSSNVKIDVHHELRRSKKARKAKDFSPEFYSFLLENNPKTYNEL